MEKPCYFCETGKLKSNVIIAESESFYARWDDFPVSPGHAEIVARKHTPSFFELTVEEINDLFELSKKVKGIVDARYHPDAYNIGINEGEAAGRTIDHLHLHIIPRYKGDVENPRGGVRHVIPGKGNY